MKSMLLLVLIVVFITAGCATIIDGQHQYVMATTLNNYSEAKTECRFTNEEGEWSAKPSQIIEIHRDGNPMIITCRNDLQSGSKAVYPRFSGKSLFLDFMLDVCTISCLVDGLTNSFYHQPPHAEIFMRNIEERN